MSFKYVKSTNERLLPRLKPMSAYQVYLGQVQGSLEAIRYQAQGMEYLPPQLGGLSGQRQVVHEAVVLQVIDFEVK